MRRTRRQGGQAGAPSPSSLDSKSSWKPRQTRGRAATAGRLPHGVANRSRAAVPRRSEGADPGQHHAALPATTRGSGVITASAPARASARSTLRRLPTP